ncbi:MAG TPA: LuxR C-terminal-related transcriptional regulator [Micromonosporaceae bacterium]
MAQWPFVARNAEIDEIARTIRNSRAGGVIVSGPAGVGKTRLAIEVSKSARSTVHIVRATRAAGTIPLGAIAHLLPAEGVPPHANPIRWAADAIAPAGSAKPLLVIDDAHALDETTAAVVHLLVHAQRARVLATIRTGETAPDPVVALWKDELAVRLDLGPFDVSGTTELLTAALGGPVARDTCERLHQVADGNALLLHELVTAAREGGALSVAGGVWWLSKDIPLSPRLTEVIEARLGALSSGERGVLEYVAFAEPISVGLLERLVNAEQVEAVEARGLIRVTADDRRLEARLDHPLFGELIRNRCGETRRRRILASLVTATSATGGRRRDDALRIAVWAVESGTPTSADALLAGAKLAWSLHDQPLAARLGRAAVAVDNSAEATLFLVDVLDSGHQYDELQELLDALPAGDYSEKTRTRLAAARIRLLAWGLGKYDDALALANATVPALSDLANRQEIEYAAVDIKCAMGHWSETASECRALIAAAASPILASQARATLTSALLPLGHLQEVIDTTNALLRDRLYWAEEYPELGGHVCVMAVLASQTIGSADAFDAAVERLEVEVASTELFANSIMVSRGVGALIRGDVSSSIALLREAETAPTNAVSSLSGMSELARALAHAGDAAGAAVALGVGSERTYTLRGQKVPFGIRLNAPWVAAAEGRISAALDLLVEAADSFRQAGTARRELIALHDAVRMGGADRVAQRLAELASTYDGTFATICADHAAAVLMHDGGKLEEVGSAFERLGRLLYAAEAYAQAAEVHHGGGSAALARAAVGRARALLAHCGGARTPAIAKLDAPGLTPRELEIALMAARGMSSSAIAAVLVLAVRTVDNHLRSVYSKLNVGGRHDLAKILAV